MNKLTFGSVCSGIEAASMAWLPIGWEASWLSEIEPFPSEVLKYHYPDTPNYGDMTKLPEMVLRGEIDAPDVLVGGTPCFTAGHLVLTDSGYIPIEDIRPGMNVVSHAGKLQKVLRVGSKAAKVGTLRAVGLPDGLVCTPEHPFRSVDFEMKNTKRGGVYARVETLGEAKWTPAKEMKGKQWCALLDYQIQQPEIVSTKFTDEQAIYISGVYLGDGHIRRWKGKNKKAVVLSLNSSKLEKLGKHIDLSSVCLTKEGSVVRVTIGDTVFAEWLINNFGELSGSKRISAWCLSSPHKDLLLEGYLDADGTGGDGKYSATSISKSLAFGVSDLANACGFASSVGFVKTEDTTIIEGRKVNQRDYWQVRMFDITKSRKSRVRHNMLLRLTQGYEETHKDTVYNIEVGGDNSYILNGAIVHNCQSFSVAGMREGLSDERGQLTIKYVELANAIDTVRRRGGKDGCIVVWENVPGVLSSKDNAFGCFIAALAGGSSEARSPGGGRWANAGYVLGPKRAVAWRILDAQYFGLAQRRKRVFVVASSRKGFCPAKVLFEFDCVRRDIAPSRETGQETTENAGAGFTPSSFGGYREGVGTLRASGGDLGGGSETLSVGKWPSDIASTNQTGFRKLTFESYAQDETASTMMARDHKSYTDLVATAVDRHAVATVYPINIMTMLGRPSDDLKPRMGLGIGKENDPQNTLSSAHCHAVATQTAVRRLTPIECERLQGFPDDFTKIPWRNKPAEDCPDGHRYKALGNSMAVPVMRWIGERIADMERT